jgi:spore coat protein U-like protein
MANVGQTPATTIEISATLMHVPSGILPAGPPYGERRKDTINVKVGEPQPFTTSISGEVAEEFKSEQRRGMGKTSIYCLGYILYEDSLRQRYRTAFLRHYNASTKRFEMVSDPDYEYQD